MKHEVAIHDAVERLPDDTIGPLQDLFIVIHDALKNRKKRLEKIDNIHRHNKPMHRRIDALIAAEIDAGADLEDVINRVRDYEFHTDEKRIRAMYEYIKPIMTRRDRYKRDDYIMQLWRLGRPLDMIAKAAKLKSSKQVTRIAKQLATPADITTREKNLRRR
ncbi:MAG: hypothetical protein AAF221_08415 [Pseudomonadota bacterium]